MSGKAELVRRVVVIKLGVTVESPPELMALDWRWLSAARRMNNE